MTRPVLTAAIDSEWSVATERKPCPVCGSAVSCSLHASADFACCMREPSQWKVTNGAWLHPISAEGSAPSKLTATAASESKATHTVDRFRF